MSTVIIYEQIFSHKILISKKKIVLNEQPENLDVMMSLATVYEEQSKEEEALELVDFGKKRNVC
jgi:hypothetical protein